MKLYNILRKDEKRLEIYDNYNRYLDFIRFLIRSMENNLRTIIIDVEKEE